MGQMAVLRLRVLPSNDFRLPIYVVAGQEKQEKQSRTKRLMLPQDTNNLLGKGTENSDIAFGQGRSTTIIAVKERWHPF